MGVFNDIKKVKDITVVQKIGSGNFSTVYKGIMGVISHLFFELTVTPRVQFLSHLNCQKRLVLPLSMKLLFYNL